MVNKLDTIYALIIALFYSFLVMILASVVFAWVDFFFTPALWVEWNLLTLPMIYYIECGFFALMRPYLFVAFIIVFLVVILIE